jgi:hypothetical protein
VDFAGDILSCVDGLEHLYQFKTIEKSEGMVVMEAVTQIKQLAREVMWRKRLLALQDTLALGIFIAGILSAGAVLYLKWQALRTPVWMVVAATFVLSLGGLVIRWQVNRANEHEAGFLIDHRLSLEDRFATAQTILEKSEPKNAIEEAQLHDAAKRIEDAQAAAIVPFRLKKFYALSAVALVALVTALLIPQKSLPGGQAMAEMREEIQAAGEELEKNSTEIEKFTPPETVTADLAKEQAALGRELRNSNYDRAEALKKLGSLEERIRTRHDELKNTRAEEVVAMAERRMRSVLSNIGKDKKPQAESEKEQATIKSADNESVDSQKPDAKNSIQASTQKSDANDAKVAAANKTDNQKNKPVVKKPTADNVAKNQVAKNQTSGQDSQNQAPKPENQAKPQNEAKSKDSETAKSDSQAAKQKDSPDKKSGDGQQAKSGEPQKPADSSKKEDSQVAKAENQVAEKIDEELAKSLKDVEKETRPQGDNSPDKEQKAGEEEANKESANPLTGALAEQGTKALSSELLDKAKDLQAGKLSAEEIAKLGQSAAQLAKDLAPLAQSKGFQNMLEQMAKQIDPKVLEQVARELEKNEQLKKELQAAAKLLLQNQQVKEMIAGFRKMGEEMARERGDDLKQKEQQLRNQQVEAQNEQITLNAKPENGKPDGKNQPGGKGTDKTRVEQSRKLSGQGKETRFGGKLQERPGGDFVYTNNRPGSGAVRVPYSNAYPQYRREAERTVERSQIPSQMRSMVRNYFDAINPDAKKSN